MTLMAVHDLDLVATRREWEGLDHLRRPQLIACDHPTDDGSRLCPACLDQTRRMLDDLPDLIVQLDLARVKDVTFVDHGQPREADPDEADLPWNEGASKVWHQLWATLRAACSLPGIRPSRSPNQIIADLAANLSRLVKVDGFPAVAHRLSSLTMLAMARIDAPHYLHPYGPCPECGAEIYQERIHPTDTTTKVECGAEDCGYTATVTQHNQNLLDAADNRLMTVREIVAQMGAAGETVTKAQIDGWIMRDGLPRERRSVPRWVNQRLVDEEVWVYRLGDIRTRALLAAEKRRGRRP